jgi:hypothetical protein
VTDFRGLYKIKHALDVIIEKYEAEFVAKGFSQKQGVDYEETSDLVARYTSIKVIMSIASIFGWPLY